MIYTIEKRKARCAGRLITYYEAIRYQRITDNGYYIGGETLKEGTRKECEQYFRRKKISPEYIL